MTKIATYEIPYLNMEIFCIKLIPSTDFHCLSIILNQVHKFQCSEGHIIKNRRLLINTQSI
jgi:hypothetical protein